MNLLDLILFSALSLGLVASTATGQEEPEHSRPNTDDTEVLDVQTDAELRSILSEVGQSLVPRKCSEWNQDETRVVAVFDFRSHKELWIGKEYSDIDGLGIDGLQRTYEIRNFSKGGSPLRGSIQIKLPTSEMDLERVCFNKLQGIQVRGANNDDQGVYQSNLWKMTINDIKFGVLVKPKGLLEEKVKTGETQVTLTMSEGLSAMALRKSAEHLWALPGSLALMVLWAVGVRVLRRTRAKWREQSTTNPNATQSQRDFQIDNLADSGEQSMRLLKAPLGDETLPGIGIKDDHLPQTCGLPTLDVQTVLLFRTHDAVLTIIDRDCLTSEYEGHIRLIVEEHSPDPEAEGARLTPETFAMQTDRGDWLIKAIFHIPEGVSKADQTVPRMLWINLNNRSLHFFDEEGSQVSVASGIVARVIFHSRSGDISLSCMALASDTVASGGVGKLLDPTK